MGDNNCHHNLTTQFDHADYDIETGSSAVTTVNLILQHLNSTNVANAGCDPQSRPPRALAEL